MMTETGVDGEETAEFLEDEAVCGVAFIRKMDPEKDSLSGAHRFA
jgi:hypothetical protein